MEIWGIVGVWDGETLTWFLSGNWLVCKGGFLDYFLRCRTCCLFERRITDCMFALQALSGKLPSLHRISASLKTRIVEKKSNLSDLCWAYSIFYRAENLYEYISRLVLPMMKISGLYLFPVTSHKISNLWKNRNFCLFHRMQTVQPFELKVVLGAEHRSTRMRRKRWAQLVNAFSRYLCCKILSFYQTLVFRGFY